MRLALLRTTDGPRLALGLPGDQLIRLERIVPQATDNPLAFLALPAGTRRDVDARVATALADARTRQRLVAAGDLTHVDDVRLEPPVRNVGKIICLALNYRAHAEEGDFTPPSRPVIFLKGPNSLTGHGDTVVVPPFSRRLDHEGELAVVIGRRCRGLTADNWRSAVAGYTVMNDLTARDLQLEDIAQQHPWDFAKSLDGYGPLGPWLVTPDEVPDPQRLTLEVRVDGQVRQHSSTAAMIFGIRDLLVYVSAGMTLEPGDIIATGTCGGIAAVAHGSVMEVEISGLGVLRNPVCFEDA